MKNKILKILKDNKNQFISGENLSKDFGITRAAIWKYMNALKEEG
ncbi:HTH domain-containing protein, partial [Clostridium sp.]